MKSLITSGRARQATQLINIDQEWLDSLIDVASERVRTYCDRPFTKDDYIEVHNGDGTLELILNQRPLDTFTSVTITDSWEESETLTDEQFNIDYEVSYIRFKPLNTANNTNFVKGTQNISVVYSAGLAEVPSTVQEACVQLVSWFYSQRPAVGRVRIQDFTEEMSSFGRGMPTFIKQLLFPYRNISFGGS